MEQDIDVSRRAFLRAGAVATGGLVIGCYVPFGAHWVKAAAPRDFSPNVFLRVGSDDSITVTVGQSEMGQGVLTSLPMIVAEELEADWSKIRVERGGADPRFALHPLGQITGSSRSVRGGWDILRKAGASAREMLIAAAAQTWGVNPTQCRAENAAVLHPRSGRRLSYGTLAERAATLPVPTEPRLKDPKDFKLIGRPLARTDAHEKVTGQAVFGLDVKRPGLLTATVVRAPVFGGKLKSFDATAAKAVKGVKHVVAINTGVAVVADGFWAAEQGRRALKVVWDDGPNAALSSAAISQVFAMLAREPGVTVRQNGDAAKVLAAARKRLEAVYELPFLAHACMEPMNCTAEVRADGAEVWAPTQAQGFAQRAVAKITGLPAERIRVHTTLLGGGFGRRVQQDFVAEAVQVSKLVGAPVKVVWTREDDMRGGHYRPANYNVLQAVLDARGNPLVWTHRIVAPSIFHYARLQFGKNGNGSLLDKAAPSIFKEASSQGVKDGKDPTAIEGAANFPYSVPNVMVEYRWKDTGVPVWFWRSVGSSQNAFITESFIDELAHLTGRDPYRYRRALLANKPRYRRVLDLAAAKAGWGKPLPKGVARGIAVHECCGAWVAQVAEVSVATDGRVRVHRVVCAVDCGTVVNPDTVQAQMESGIVYGLTAALYGEITLKDGRVEQGNFDTYPLLGIGEMPRIDVHLVASREPPGGVGEPGTPPIAPAVCNAIFAATGKRIRRLPIRCEELARV